MRFLLDENVPRAVAETLRDLGHDVKRSTELVAVGAADPVVAIAAMEDDRILVSHDRDMRKIERAGALAGRPRYQRLHCLMLSCAEPTAAARVRAFMPVIEADYICLLPEQACRMFFEVGDTRARLFR